MYKLIKYIWDKAEKQTMRSLLYEIETRAKYHSQQAEIAYYKNRYESDDKKSMYNDMDRWSDNHTPGEHEAAAKALWKLIDDLNPRESNDREET